MVTKIKLGYDAVLGSTIVECQYSLLFSNLECIWS